MVFKWPNFIMSIKLFSTSFVIKVVFEHLFRNAMKIFETLRDPEIATMASQKAKFRDKFALNNVLI